MTNKVLFALLTIFLLVTRLWSLREVPVGLTHDEVAYTFEAKMIATDGKGLDPDWKLWSLMPFDRDFAELPAQMMVPAMWIFPNDPLIAARATDALLSLLFPFALGYLTYGLTQKKKIAYATTILAAFNPWLLQYGRMAFDPYLSLFFLTLYGGMSLSKKKSQQILALVPLFLAFFQYQGHKLVVLPFALTIYLVGSKRKQESSKFRLVGLGLALILLVWYLGIALPNQSAAERAKDNILTNEGYLAQEVDTKRKYTLANPFNPIMTNKYTERVDYMTEHYLAALNPIQLFYSADEGASPFAVASHGYFYLFELPLMLIGLWYVIKQKASWQEKSWLLMLVAGAAAAMITITGNSFSFKASMMYLILLILSGIGLSYLWNLGKAWRLGVVLVLLFSIGNFCYQYFYRYPFYSADGFYFSERLLASYLERLPSQEEVVIYTPEPDRVLKSYLYYANKIDKNSVEEIRKAFENEDVIRFGTITLTRQCFEPADLGESEVVIKDVDITACPKASWPEEIPQKIIIPRVTDAGERMNIWHDRVCEEVELKGYPYPTGLASFGVEDLSTEEYCYSWLTLL